jgi:protein SCO1
VAGSSALIQIKLFVGFFWTDFASDFNCCVRSVTLIKVAGTGCAILALIGCGRSSQALADNARHYEARGIVRGVALDRRTIDIEHEDIRGFMPSMTMPLSARNPKEAADLKIGDAIAFRLNVTDRDVWIDNVRKIPAGEVHLPTPTSSPAISPQSSSRLQEGDEMLAFSLTNQNGERISLDAFRGQPFVLTFVFTRCPLPNFCPRMSNNFEELQTAIKAGSGTLATTHLLSVTLDPDYDTPKVLREYAAFHHADSKIWTFGTGDEKEIDSLTRAFSVYRQTEGGTISHGLATALINQNGTVKRIWRGNAWTPAEVTEAIRAETK